MIWNEMIYNKIQMDLTNDLEVEPEELDKYYKTNTKKKEEYFDGFDKTNTFVLD